MKAKCPHCENGCENCDGGYIEVNFATADLGHYHYMICNDCGCETGGHLHEHGTNLPEKPSPHAVCPHCGGHSLRFSTCEDALGF